MFRNLCGLSSRLTSSLDSPSLEEHKTVLIALLDTLSGDDGVSPFELHASGLVQALLLSLFSCLALYSVSLALLLSLRSCLALCVLALAHAFAKYDSILAIMSLCCVRVCVVMSLFVCCSLCLILSLLYESCLGSSV